MPIDSAVTPASMLGTNLTWIWWTARPLIVLLAVCYFIFSLVIVRQVNLMTETLITENAPFLRAFTIINAGLALGIIILFIGALF